MRITADAKAATRRRILETAGSLFRSQGFDQTTTRDMAHAAGIAAGTLFNYFPSKESLVLTLAAEALEKADGDHRRADALEEDLFAYIAAGLRRLKPLRSFIRPALETALSPLAKTEGNELAETLRLAHLERIGQMLGEHGVAEPPDAAMSLYWTLYTGVLAFWADDSSPKQEDTWAMLDQSLAMFVAWLRPPVDE